MESNTIAKIGKVTASFGVAEFNKYWSADDFLKTADCALYKAKAAGRNRVEILNAQ